MAKMKLESIPPSVTTAGMNNIWITIRVVDNETYQGITSNNKVRYSTDHDIYVSIDEFNKNRYEAIEKAINERMQHGPLLFTKGMERTSVCGQEQTAISFDIYLATYLVEIQLPSATVQATKKNTSTLYLNAFELPQGSTISADQFKRLVLDVMKLERHIIISRDRPTEDLERHEIVVFKENDAWCYLLPDDNTTYVLPNEVTADFQLPIYDTLDNQRKHIITRVPPWRDLGNNKYGEIAKLLALSVLTLIAAAGHIPQDLGLDHHFPLEAAWNSDPNHLAMMLLQGAKQPNSNFSKLPTDLIKTIFATSIGTNPEQVSAYMDTMNESVKQTYNEAIAPLVICKANWGKTPSLSFSCPKEPALIDKFYHSGLLPFSSLIKLDRTNYQATIQSSTGAGDCGVYLANHGHELAIAFASKEERDAWAKLMGLKHDFHHQGVGIWADHPQCIYFTKRFFMIQDLKAYMQEKCNKRDAIGVYLDEERAEQNSCHAALSIFTTNLFTHVKQDMKVNLKNCYEQIIAAKLLIDVLTQSITIEDLLEKYPSTVSVIEDDELLNDIWSSLDKKSHLQHGAM